MMGLFFLLYFKIQSINQFKMKNLFPFLLSVILFTSCGKNIDYTPEHIKQTSGRYIFNQNEVIDVYYEDTDLYIHWKGGKMKPVVLDENTFFVADMYQKLRFVKHPTTNKRFLGVVSETDETDVEYAYPKVEDTFKTPRMYLNDKEYDKATEGFLRMQQQDSSELYFNEAEFNRLGYNLLGDKEYENAIAVFKMNVALFPASDNVYDSLADAYARSGDTLQALANYKVALELNTGNKRAKEFVEKYGNK